MPITPHFDISQTTDHVVITIRIPHVRVSPDSVQVVLTDENRCLHFASPPYLLVLTFQQAFQENADESCAQYDPLHDNGRIVLTLAKGLEQQHHWDDLDMIGALVKPQSQQQNLANFVRGATAAASSSPQKSTWIKEVLGETTTADTGLQHDDDEESNNDHPSSTPFNSSNDNGYGFGRMFQNVFVDLARDGLAREMLEVPVDQQGQFLTNNNNIVIDQNEDASIVLDPQQQSSQPPNSTSTSNSNPQQQTRQQQRQEMEESKFSTERYLQDLDVSDDYLYQIAMGMQPHWNQNQQPTTSSSYFTPEENTQLSSIPYPLLPLHTNTTPPDEYGQLWLGILDLLFAYCYDHLLTDGDPNVESAWTVSILSVSLSWLEDVGSTNIASIVTQSTRRALIYPYLRSLDFCAHIWKQVAHILRVGGRRCVIRCLLQLRGVLDQSELYYLGNKLYIDPYLAWLQDSRRHPPVAENGDDRHLLQLSNEIHRNMSDFNVLKERIGLDLIKIELEPFGDEEKEEDAASSSASSDSSDSSDDESSSSEDGEEDDKQDEPAVANDLLDTNLGSTNKIVGDGPSNNSLLVDMSKLSLDTNEEDKKDGSPKVAPKSLIQELS